MKRLLTTILVAAALSGLAGATFAQTSFADIEAAARAEGQLVIYTSTAVVEMEKHVALFEQAYPEIHVEFIRLPSSQLFSRFTGELEANAPQADFLSAGSTALFQQSPELFIPLTAENVPNFALTTIPSVGNSYAIFQADPHYATYNTDLVTADDLANHLATWEGLADPRWKGKIALVSPESATTQISFLMLLRDTYGPEWFERFNQNEYELVATASAAAQQVAAGAYELLMPTITEQSAGVRAEGAPVALHLPTGPVHVAARGMAVPVSAPHPNAALVYLNWKLGHDGQLLTCQADSIPVYPLPEPECADNVLPESFTQARDIIDPADTAEVFSLVGLQP